jgi:hypothetical protein
MRWGVAEHWLIVEGSSLFRIRLTQRPDALCRPRASRARPRFSPCSPSEGFYSTRIPMAASPPPNLEATSLALHLVGDLYDLTGDLAQQWRVIDEWDAATRDAIMYANTRGWLLIVGGCCIRLTDAGRAWR